MCILNKVLTKTRPKYSGPYLIIDINWASLKLLSLDEKHIWQVNCDLTKPRIGLLSRKMIDILERFNSNLIDLSKFEKCADEDPQ